MNGQSHWQVALAAEVTRNFGKMKPNLDRPGVQVFLWASTGSASRDFLGPGLVPRRGSELRNLAERCPALGRRDMQSAFQHFPRQQQQQQARVGMLGGQRPCHMRPPGCLRLQPPLCLVFSYLAVMLRRKIGRTQGCDRIAGLPCPLTRDCLPRALEVALRV